jgi:polyphosphate glucokinase
MPGRAKGKKGKQASDEPVLSIDIGGTGLKASVVDASGNLVVPRRRLETPNSCPPSVMLDALAELVAPLPPHNRIAIGFPGVVRSGKVITAWMTIVSNDAGLEGGAPLWRLPEPATAQ